MTIFLEKALGAVAAMHKPEKQRVAYIPTEKDANRLQYLSSLYLKITYALDEERKLAEPSSSVIYACEIAKRIIFREYEALCTKMGARHGHA